MMIKPCSFLTNCYKLQTFSADRTVKRSVIKLLCYFFFADALAVTVGYFIIALAFFYNVYISPQRDPEAVDYNGCFY